MAKCLLCVRRSSPTTLHKSTQKTLSRPVNYALLSTFMRLPSRHKEFTTKSTIKINLHLLVGGFVLWLLYEEEKNIRTKSFIIQTISVQKWIFHLEWKQWIQINIWALNQNAFYIHENQVNPTLFQPSFFFCRQKYLKWKNYVFFLKQFFIYIFDLSLFSIHLSWNHASLLLSMHHRIKMQ